MVSKGRNELKKHVRAAKEWLGEAEQSLDNEENVRGDLSVMLAKAELQHASETNTESSFIIAIKRLLPLVIAIVLAGIWFGYTNKEEKMPQAIVTIPVEKSVERIDKTVTEKKSVSSETTVENETIEKEEEPASTQELVLPSEKMQKLMCTAGQNLRSQ